GVASLQGDGTLGRDQQAGDQPQQRGLAGAIGPGHRQRFASGGLEIEAVEDLPAAPDASDTASREAHRALSKLGGRATISGRRDAGAQLSVWQSDENDSISRNLM